MDEKINDNPEEDHIEKTPPTPEDFGVVDGEYNNPITGNEPIETPPAEEPEPEPEIEKEPHAGGRPLLFETVEDLIKAIQSYFDSCWTQKLNIYGAPIFKKDENSKKTNEPVLYQFKPYTVSGLAVYLNTSRETLINYEKRGEYFDTIKKAKDICHAYAEEQLFQARNATGAIFNLKNNYGWKDEVKYDHTSKGKSIAPKIISDV